MIDVIHNFLKFQVSETGRRMKELLEKEVIPAITQRSECLADWYKMAQTVFLQAQILDKDMDNYERVIETFSLRLSQDSKERFDHISRTLDAWLPSAGKQQQTTTATKLQSEMDEVQKRKAIEEKKWKEICAMQEQILLILYKNNMLVEELNTVAMKELSLKESLASEDMQLMATGGD